MKGKYGNMLLIFVIISLFVFIIFLSGCFNEEVADNQMPKDYPLANMSYDNRTILNIVSSEVIGRYNVIGYVDFISECLDCIGKIPCSPCAPDHIRVRDVLAESDFEGASLIIKVNNPQQFVLGKKYIFSVEVYGEGSFSNIILLGYNEVDESVSLEFTIEEPKTWIEVIPMQCEFEPWQYEWIKAHDDNKSAYPWINYPEKIKQEEKKIITAYFRRNKSISIYNVDSDWTFGDTCDACGICADGYSIYLLIDDSNAEKLLNMGYRLKQ